MTDVTDLVCFCNNVKQQRVRAAIADGANTLEELFDRCSAGVGPCGGSCRTQLLQLIREEKAKLAPDQVSPTVLDRPWVPPSEVIRAISLFNRRYYWETHEILEALWLEEHGDTKIFYQGIIQAAAALYHVLNSNPKGVIKLVGDSTAKLNRFLPRYKSIPLESLVERLQEFAEQAREILGNTRPGFDYDKLPQIQILT